MKKTCRICGQSKEITEFHKKKESTIGCRNECKECVKKLQEKYKTPEVKEKQKEYLKEWRKNNKNYQQSSERKEYRKNWRENNKEKIAEQTKEYAKNNKEHLRNVWYPKRNKKYKEKLNDPLFKIKESVRCSIRRSIKVQGFKKNLHTEKILGCSYSDFKKYLENQFESWMTYENYGKYNGEFNYGWDIDHIIPISTAKSEAEIVKLNHFTNLQPLCSKINRDIKRNN